MAAEEAAVNLVAAETLDPASPAPTLDQRPDDGLAVLAAGTFSKPIQPPRTPDSGLFREQITPRLQVHLAAAESRVSNALHQVMESVEKKLLEALKQAAIDIIDNLGKEAAECILLSQRKAAMLEYELNYSKENALALLMQVKRVSDAQISDAENKVLIERRRAQEAEAKLHLMQENNKKLKAELKRKGQQVEELQRCINPATVQQGLKVNVTEGPESRKGGNRLKSSGENKSQQISDARHDAGVLAIQPEMTTFDCSANGLTDVQTENVLHHLTCHPAYKARRDEKGALANGVLPQERANLEVTHTDHVIVNKIDSQQGSPRNQSVSVAGINSIPAEVFLPPSSSECSLPAVSHGEVSPSLKADLESRSTNASDEEKSSLTIEALYCNDESLPPQVHPGDEYESNKTRDHVGLDMSSDTAALSFGGKKGVPEADISIHCAEELEIDGGPERASTSSPNTSRIPKTVKGDDKRISREVFESSGGVAEEFQDGHETQENIQGSGKAGRESNETVEGVHTVVADESVLKKAEASPVTGQCNSDAPCENPQVVISTHCGNLPNGDARRPEPQTESPDNLVTKRKRKQGASLSNYDLVVTERSSKRLQADGAATGACDLLAAAGVDAHISSRDSRRLMQGARQLFSLAEGKWR